MDLEIITLSSFVTDIIITREKKIPFLEMKTLSICVRCNNTYSSFVKEKWTKEGIMFKVYRCESCGRWKHFKGYMDVILVYQPGFFFILNEDSEKLTLKRKNNKK